MITKLINGGRFRRGRAPLALMAASAMAMTLAACGGSSDSGPSTKGVDFDKLTVAQLYAKAKVEGEVAVNSGASDDDMKIIAAGFNKLYPGIKIVHFEQQGEDSAAKLSAEANAGVYKTDLLDTEQNTAYEVAKAGLLAKYTPPAAAKFDARLKQPEFTGYRIQIKAITYNTDKVKGADVPTGYQDLLDPKWKNKVCVEESEVSTFADMLTDLGRDKGLAYWKALNANGLRFVKGQSDLVQAVVAGDCPISVAANVHSTAQQMAKGAPINWVKTDPLYANYGALGIVAKAPHPYAARLWMNYLLSDAGQQSVADDYRIPANSEVQPKEPELKQGTFKMVLAGIDVMKNFTEYNNLFYKTTGRPVVAP